MIDINVLRYLIDFKLDIRDSDVWDSGYYSIPYYKHLDLSDNIINVIQNWTEAVDELSVDWNNPTEYSYDMIDMISCCCGDIEDELIKTDKNYKSIMKSIDAILDDYEFPSTEYEWEECNERLDDYLKNLELKEVKL